MNPVKRQFLEEIKDEPKVYADDYQVMDLAVKGSRAYYKGKPVPFSYQPWFVMEEEFEAFKNIGETMMTIGKKVIDAYLKNEEIRELFAFPDWIEELILVENPLNGTVPMARFDIFYDNPEEFYFCELNTDGSSAMNEDNELAEIWLRGHMAAVLSRDWQLSYFEMFYSWVEDVMKIYEENGGEGFPNVAIMDFKDSATSEEFLRYQEAFQSRGCGCEIVDIRELDYRDGKLYAGDFDIDIIYRRMVTFELIERPEGTEAFQQAYKDNAVLTIGPISTQVIHNKLFFAMLFRDEIRNLLTEEEKHFIDHHVPKTYVLEKEMKQWDDMVQRKDEYILKPMDRNASTGVMAGLDLSQEKWEETLEKCAGEDYLIQQFIKPYKKTYAFYDEEKEDWLFRKLGAVVGMFLFREKLTGLYTRLGEETIISGLTGYYATPHIKVEREE